MSTPAILMLTMTIGLFVAAALDEVAIRLLARWERRQR